MPTFLSPLLTAALAVMIVSPASARNDETYRAVRLTGAEAIEAVVGNTIIIQRTEPKRETILYLQPDGTARTRELGSQPASVTRYWSIRNRGLLCLLDRPDAVPGEFECVAISLSGSRITIRLGPPPPEGAPDDRNMLSGWVEPLNARNL